MASSSTGQKECDDVQFNEVPEPLYDRLGDQATIGMLDILESSEREWSTNVLTAASDRFERRLAEELGALRVEMTHAMTALARDLRQEMATTRVELLKWSFLFWVGQLAAVSGLIAVVLRAGR